MTSFKIQLKWLIVVLPLTLVTFSTPLEVNVHENYCGYVFIFIDKNAKNVIVDLDENGIGFINEDFARKSEKVTYHILNNGKDITRACNEFKVHSIGSSISLKKRTFLSFKVRCNYSKLDKHLTEDDRFEQIKDIPKIANWLGN